MITNSKKFIGATSGCSGLALVVSGSAVATPKKDGYLRFGICSDECIHTDGYILEQFQPVVKFISTGHELAEAGLAERFWLN